MRLGTALRTIALLALVAGAGAAAYWWFGRGPAVSVVTPTRGDVVAAVYATGSVEPVTWARIGPTVRGRIVAYRVREGSRVKAGDVLVQLDDAEQQATVRKLEAELDLRQRALRRIQPLGKADIAAARDVEAANSALAQGEAELEAARKRLSDLALRAPFDGVVIRKDFEVGDYPGADDTLVWLAGDDGLWITADVDEEDIPRVRVGMETLIKADAFPHEVFPAQVDEITPKGDPIEKSYRVRVRLPATTPLQIGMTTEINVITDRRADVLLVPASAVVGNAVWTVVGGRARAASVTVGVRGTDRIEIVDGLAPDARVILVPPKAIAEGDRVRAVPVSLPEPAKSPSAPAVASGASG